MRLYFRLLVCRSPYFSLSLSGNYSAFALAWSDLHDAIFLYYNSLSLLVFSMALTDYIDKKTACVYGIYGALGGGKTITSVEIALWALRNGWKVTSNVELKNLPENLVSQYTYIPDFERIDFWALPCGAPRGSSDDFRSVVIVDECAEFFDQFSSTSPILKSFLSWLRHSSKRGQLVFLIVQQPEFLAKSLRLVINKWIVCLDLDSFHLPIIRLKLPLCGDFIWRRVFDRWGNLISRGFNLCRKSEVGRYYDTAQSIALSGRSTDYERKTKPPPVIWEDFGIFAFLCFLWYFLAFFYD